MVSPTTLPAAGLNLAVLTLSTAEPFLRVFHTAVQPPQNPCGTLLAGQPTAFVFLVQRNAAFVAESAFRNTAGN